jgi:hypothetical protein
MELAMIFLASSLRTSILVALFLCVAAQWSFADTRIALVIGNGAYRNAPTLPNPANDATDVAAALERSGFDVILATDLDRAGMDEATIRFARAARTADVAMFYYSGHALQFGGVNYLVPVDTRLTDEADLRRMTRVDEVVADLAQAKNLRILVLDSCRDNPLADQLKRSIGASRAMSLQRGLAKIDSPQGMIVAYATQAGQTADDGSGHNSPYTTAFLKHIDEREEIGSIFRRVSADVYETTRHAQLPELSLSLIGEFYLRGRGEITITPGNTLPLDESARTKQPQDQAAQAWTVTQNTSSIAVLEDFIRQFGSTVYGSMARARLEELKKSQSAVVLPPVASTGNTYSKSGNFACFGKAEYPDSWRTEAPLCVTFGCNFGKMSRAACLALAASKQSKTVIHGNAGTTRANECWLQHSCGDLRPHGEFTLFKM